MTPTLTAVSGPLAGRSFPLGPAGLTFGRERANDLHLRDLAVSRLHCKVTARDGGFVLLGGGWAGVESVRAERLQSLLAAPLAGRAGTLGLLYLDTREPDLHFDARHLELTTAVAGIAAAALANVRHLEALEEESRRIEGALDAGMIGDSPRLREL